MQQNDKDSETIKYKYALVNQGAPILVFGT